MQAHVPPPTGQDGWADFDGASGSMGSTGSSTGSSGISCDQMSSASSTSSSSSEALGGGRGSTPQSIRTITPDPFDTMVQYQTPPPAMAVPRPVPGQMQGKVQIENSGKSVSFVCRRLTDDCETFIDEDTATAADELACCMHMCEACCEISHICVHLVPLFTVAFGTGASGWGGSPPLMMAPPGAMPMPQMHGMPMFVPQMPMAGNVGMMGGGFVPVTTPPVVNANEGVFGASNPFGPAFAQETQNIFGVATDMFGHNSLLNGPSVFDPPPPPPVSHSPK